MIPKAELRKRFAAIRAALSAEARAKGSARAAEVLIASGLLEGVQTLALFCAFGDEADPIALEGAAPRIAYPCLAGRDLSFHLGRRAELVEGPAFGILEPPASAPRVALIDIDLFVIPGLGFGPAGERLGYGRGYYDRALGAAKAQRPGVLALGFGFAEQVALGITMTPLDHWIDGVITPDGLLLAPPR